MSMRLGFVGVGRHAQRMATAFRDCGATLSAYDRASPHMDTVINGMRARDNLRTASMSWGDAKYTPWQTMTSDPDIDAIVCCAPPDVNQRVAIACEDYQKDCCVAKPFPLVKRLWQATHMSHSLYVDLWRLYSPAWQALKADIAHRKVTDVAISFCGDGPVRKTHSGLLDYGPHALAFLLDLGIDARLTWECVEVDTGKGLRRHWVARGAGGNGESVIVRTGNAGGDLHPESHMQAFIETDDGGQYRWRERGQLHTYEAGGAQLMQHWRDLALRSFCRAFMAGESSPDTLRISFEAMRLLSEAGPDGQAYP